MATSTARPTTRAKFTAPDSYFNSYVDETYSEIAESIEVIGTRLRVTHQGATFDAVRTNGYGDEDLLSVVAQADEIAKVEDFMFQIEATRIADWS